MTDRLYFWIDDGWFRAGMIVYNNGELAGKVERSLRNLGANFWMVGRMMAKLDEAFNRGYDKGREAGWSAGYMNAQYYEY